jgi:hypothetical protein
VKAGRRGGRRKVLKALSTRAITTVCLLQRLFLIFVPSSVCASATMRTIAAANAASALGVGWVTEGFAGQTTMTKLGLSAGWCSSTLRRSPERLRAPEAKSLMG